MTDSIIKALLEWATRIKMLAADAKTAAATATATTTVSAGDWFEIIPDDIGKLGTLIGILLSTVLICVHALSIRNMRLEYQLLKNRQMHHVEEKLEREAKGLSDRRNPRN